VQGVSNGIPDKMRYHRNGMGCHGRTYQGDTDAYTDLAGAFAAHYTHKARAMKALDKGMDGHFRLVDEGK